MDRRIDLLWRSFEFIETHPKGELTPLHPSPARAPPPFPLISDLLALHVPPSLNPSRHQPLLDTYNVVTDTPIGITEHTNPVKALAITRLMEVAMDSLPQALWQSRVLVQLTDRDPLIWASIGGSAFSIAYLVATFELDIDTVRSWPGLGVGLGLGLELGLELGLGRCD